MHGKERVQGVEPAGGVCQHAARIGRTRDAQVARDGGARRYLRGPVRRAVLIGVAETSRVDEAERACVVEEEVEYRPRVEEGHLIEIAVRALEGVHAGGELRVVVVERGRYRLHRSMSLFEKEGRAVRRRNGQEEERSRATVIQLFDLYIISVHE